MGAGMVAGAAVTMVTKTVMGKNKHNITKGSAKFVKAMGDVVDSVQTMFK